MAMLVAYDPILEKLQKHFEKFGLPSSIVEQKLDFESDYLDSNLLGTTKGVGSAGSLKLFDSPIDYINIIKKQEYVKCDFAAGGFAGMGIHLHSWWKFRFFISFPESINLGPFDIGTISTVKKGLLHSELEDFVWSGYQKLTTLPPGLIRDNVADVLYSDQLLGKLMKECLLKERTILVSRYSPSKENKGMATNSKIVIQSTWKLRKDLFIDGSTIDMYEKIAENVKTTVNKLKYHLR
jgi:hypothetical protein